MLCVFSLGQIVILQNAPLRPFQVVVLTGFQRPQERCQAQQPEKQRDWNEIDQHVHQPRSPACADPNLRRSALAVTTIEDPDMARAAMSGVTKPAIAKGTATTLYSAETQRILHHGAMGALRDPERVRHRLQPLTEENRIRSRLADVNRRHR